MKIKITNKGINIALGVIIMIVLYGSIMYITKDKTSSLKTSAILQQDNIIGKIKYLDCYMYFDRDGNVLASEVISKSTQSTKDKNHKSEDSQVESLLPSENTVESIPSIEGFDLPYVQLKEKLPVKDKQVFNTIIALNRMIEKNSIIPDRIVFDEKNRISLFYGVTQIMLGRDYLLEEKITRLTAILPNLNGMEGILHLENLEKDTKNIIFEKPNNEKEILIGEEVEMSEEGNNNEEETQEMLEVLEEN